LIMKLKLIESKDELKGVHTFVFEPEYFHVGRAASICICHGTTRALDDRGNERYLPSPRCMKKKRP